jgi:tRNA U34 5-methylaminomethyl-2-thiouridine-forming methyltransferase MnmC
MKSIKTKDGSVTYHSEWYGETYHSVSGAKQEAVEKYSRPCGIDSREKVTLLDICFGLGYNSAAAIDMFSGKKMKIIALENDPEIVAEIMKIEYPFKCAEIIRKVAADKKYQDDKISIELIMGDARETIKKLSTSFDVVFLDPFSPSKCPELWKKEFFDEIYRVMKKKSVLATYSCAGNVRRALKEAGFSVADGPCVGRRSPSTIATKS